MNVLIQLDRTMRTACLGHPFLPIGGKDCIYCQLSQTSACQDSTRDDPGSQPVGGVPVATTRGRSHELSENN